MFKRYWKDFAIFWGLFIVFVAGVFFFFYLVSAGKLGFMPTFEELENPKNKFATEIYSEDGKILGKYFEGSENRRYMDYKDIPQSVIDALIATEDVRFYDHSGIDVRGLFRVAQGMLTGNSSAGGEVRSRNNWRKCCSRGRRTRTSWSWPCVNSGNG